MRTHRIMLIDCPYIEILDVFNSFKFISKRFPKNQPNLQKWQLFHMLYTSLIEAPYDPNEKTRDAQMCIPEHSIGFFEWRVSKNWNPARSHGRKLEPGLLQVCIECYDFSQELCAKRTKQNLLMCLGASLRYSPHKNTNMKVKYEYSDKESFESILDKLRIEEQSRPRTMFFNFQGLSKSHFHWGMCYWASWGGGVLQS